MSAFCVSLSDRFSSCLKRLPLLSPDAGKWRCAVDEESLNKRISAIVLVALVTLVASFVIPLAYPSVALAFRLVSVVALATVPLDAWLIEKKLNAIAVAEYMNPNRDPSFAAMCHLQNHLKAVQLLVNQKGNLNRENRSLLDGISDFKVFKYLMDQGADVVQRNGGGYQLILQQLVKNPDPRFLEHALKQGKVVVDQISQGEQVPLWLHLGSRKAGELLKQHGFDLNVRNQWQTTPLIALASATWLGKEERIEKIKTLLELGADRSLKSNQGKTASECAVNAEIRKLIDEWKSPTR